MRAAPPTHRGFAVAIVLTSAATSVLTGGRPPRDRPERRVQYSRKRRRCQRTTVSGETVTLHPGLGGAAGRAAGPRTTPGP
jgi:hypothetical protein